MAKCPHTMKVGQRDGSVICADCGKTVKRKPAKPKGSTFTLRGADCHRFLRTIDPTFPLHPDEKEHPHG